MTDQNEDEIASLVARLRAEAVLLQSMPLYPEGTARALIEAASALSRVAEERDAWEAACDGNTALGAEIAEGLKSRLDTAEAELSRVREALEWYGEQARLARLIHSGGDPARFALSDDGGKRARLALSPVKDG